MHSNKVKFHNKGLYTISLYENKNRLYVYNIFLIWVVFRVFPLWFVTCRTVNLIKVQKTLQYTCIYAPKKKVKYALKNSKTNTRIPKMRKFAIYFYDKIGGSRGCAEVVIAFVLPRQYLVFRVFIFDFIIKNIC